MKIPLSGQKDFEQAPTGAHLAVLVDWVFLGPETKTFQGKETTKNKIRLTWQLATEMKSEPRRAVISRKYTCSMHPSGWLRKHLEAWAGKAIPDDKAKDFEIENLINMNCILFIKEFEATDGTGKKLSAVDNVMPYDKRYGAKIVPEGYVRVKDRPEKEENGSQQTQAPQTPQSTAKPAETQPSGFPEQPDATFPDDDSDPFNK
jgi:hypothetical protein